MDKGAKGSVPFELVAGALCLDLVNTLDSRLDPAPVDLLATYEDVLRFSQVAGSVDAGEAAILSRAAHRDPGAALSVLRQTVALREALSRLLTARLDSAPFDLADLAVLNAVLAVAGTHERLIEVDGQLQWQWAPLESDGMVHLDRPLWPLARSAAHLLTGQISGALRVCAADDCSVLFLDRTRNQSRRWCSRQGCGNRERVRQFRRRQRTADNTGTVRADCD
jgi:predicted RNA-binding Zn ribbon-like protein